MYCPQCQGYGFYILVRDDGVREGRVCLHPIKTPFVLLQDQEIEAPCLRPHTVQLD